MSIKSIIKQILRVKRKSFWITIIYKTRFKDCGKNTIIERGFKVLNPKFVSLGNDVIIRENTSFCINPLGEKAELIIGNRVDLGKKNDFGCSNRIVIEDDVITAPFVHITDRDHSYTDILTPIMNQSANSKGPVVIGSGSWIGFGAQIMSGVKIGKHCVIAAGSIVTKDIPDYSVVGGNPAKVLKQYNQDTRKWERTK